MSTASAAAVQQTEQHGGRGRVENVVSSARSIPIPSVIVARLRLP